MTNERSNIVAALKGMGFWSRGHLLFFTITSILTATFISSSYLNRSPVRVLETGEGQSTGLTSDVRPALVTASKVKILSFDPFIAHITDFISESEREYLINIGNPLLEKSFIRNDDGSEVVSEARTSSTAFLPDEDPVVQAVAQRAADFQGFLSPKDVDVQITSYNPGQQYKHHYDWYPPPRSSNRISTFFAILKSTCDNCGTEFPFINVTGRVGYDDRWCNVLDCSKELLTTRNIEGSALFWLNLNDKAEGRIDTLHAGLPALNGDKVGLNIWTDIDLTEVKNRGVFGGQSKHYFQPSKEFLESHGLVNNG